MKRYRKHKTGIARIVWELTDPELHERFWSKVDKAPTREGCWNWLAYLTPYGYGEFSLNRVAIKAHRLAFALHCGARIPKDVCVLHRCDNTRCVNPDHLWLGTKADNSKDMVAKGRNAGLRIGYSEGRVRKIRRLRERGWTYKRIAERYGVSLAYIYGITKGSLRKGVQ